MVRWLGEGKDGKMVSNIKVVRWLGKIFLSTYLSIHLSICLLLSTCLYGAFEEPQSNARPLGMGGGFVAVSDDVNSLNYNPGGLGRIKKIEVSGMYSFEYGVSDLYKSFLGFVIPFGKNGAGLSWSRTALQGVYAEDSLILGFGRNFSKILFCGFSIKYLGVSVKNFSDPSLLRNKFVMAYDLGVIVKLHRQLSIGIVGQNLNSPRLKLVKTTSEQDTVYAKWRLGLAYKPKENITLLSDIKTDLGRFTNLHKNFNIGGEVLFANIIFLRLGLNSTRPTAGFGIKVSRAQLDFAVLMHRDLGLLYRISSTVRFK